TARQVFAARPEDVKFALMVVPSALASACVTAVPALFCAARTLYAQATPDFVQMRRTSTVPANCVAGKANSISLHGSVQASILAPARVYMACVQPCIATRACGRRSLVGASPQYSVLIAAVSARTSDVPTGRRGAGA